TATTVQIDNSGPLTYAGMENLTLNVADFFNVNLPGLANVILVKSTAATTTTTINGAQGLLDSFVLGSSGKSLDDIQRQLTVNGKAGRDALVLEDQGDANANSYIITSTSVARTGSALISYSLPGISNQNAKLILDAGAFDDTVAVKSTAAAT